MKKNRKDQKGFTLVELSMVIVIVGLLVGGVLVGRDLIEASKIRNVVSQLKKIETAKNTFIGKYGALPGDIRNATVFALSAAGANCTDANGDGMADTENPSGPNGSATLGCNGNADGIMDDVPPGGLPAARSNFKWEIRNFWYHLQSAGFMAIGPTTIAAYEAAAPEGNAPGVGFPDTTYSGLGIIYSADLSLATDINYFTLGATSAPIGGGNSWLLRWTTSTTARPSFLPEQAFGVDTIMDDGAPSTGLVVARDGLSGGQVPNPVVAGTVGCTTNSGGQTLYNVAYLGGACLIRVRGGA